MLHTTYRRSTLLISSLSRVTVDTGLVWRHVDGGRLPLTGFAVLETKSGPRAGLADRQLWAQGLRPTRISKYGTGLSALDGTVQANRWNPVTRRHLPSLAPSASHDRIPA